MGLPPGPPPLVSDTRSEHPGRPHLKSTSGCEVRGRRKQICGWAPRLISGRLTSLWRWNAAEAGYAPPVFLEAAAPVLDEAKFQETEGLCCWAASFSAPGGASGGGGGWLSAMLPGRARTWSEPPRRRSAPRWARCPGNEGGGGAGRTGSTRYPAGGGPGGIVPRRLP